MEQVISELIAQWGTFGLIVVLVGFIIYDYIKKNTGKKDCNVASSSTTGCLKGDLVLDRLNDIKDSINIKIDGVSANIDAINTKVECLEDKFDTRIHSLEKEVNKIPSLNIQKLEENAMVKKQAHSKQMDDVLKLGPKLYDILDDYIPKINCTHIFIGSFHNGMESITGIPYYKFDLVVERFNINDHDERDHEFAPVYKDADLLRYGKLPLALVQNKTLHFTIDDDNNSELFNLDDIIVRRMIGMGIKQIALQLLCDSANRPSGFLGCVKYDNNEMINIKELQRCAYELENIYHSMESK